MHVQVQAVPAALQLGVAPLHADAQHTLAPLAPATQWPSWHWLSAPTEQAAPFASLAWHVPALHHFPMPQSVSFTQAAQARVVGLQ